MDSLKGNRIQSSITPATILFLLCILWLNGGVVRFSQRFNASIFLLLFIAGAFCATIELKKININPIKKSGLLYGCLFFATIIPTSLIVYGTLEGEVAKVLYALILLTIQIYLKRKSKRVRQIFVVALLVDCIAINIKTITLLAVSSDISRIYASGSDAVLEKGFDIYLLGGYGYVYALVFAIVFLFIKIDTMKQLSKITKILAWTFVITGIVTIIESQYTIAILMLALGIIFTFLTKKGLSVKTVLLSFIVFLLLVVFGEMLLQYLISNNVFGSTVTDRLSQILGISSGSVSGNGDLALRIELYLRTLKYLPRCFFLGTYETIQRANSVLGWHTEWLDRLARFGILRYGLFIVFLVKSIKYSLPVLKIRSRYLIFVVCLILLGAVNPILTNNFYVVMFILIPFIFSDEAVTNGVCV